MERKDSLRLAPKKRDIAIVDETLADLMNRG
jgi:hypothetical protein